MFQPRNAARHLAADKSILSKTNHRLVVNNNGYTSYSDVLLLYPAQSTSSKFCENDLAVSDKADRTASGPSEHSSSTTSYA